MHFYRNYVNSYEFHDIESTYIYDIDQSDNSRSSLGLKSILKMTGLEPGTSRLSMLSECAYHLRYNPVDLAGLTGLQLLIRVLL